MSTGGTEEERFAAIEAAFGDRAEALLAQCEEHLDSSTATALEGSGRTQTA